jgi:chromosome segregation ATPase
MDQQQLREKLEQLHDELEQVKTVDADTRDVLDDLSKDIRELLDRPGDQDDRRYGKLSGNLRANVTRFEATHPLLTSAMQRAIDALVQMGV